jgi:lipoprotein-anchoring transpeptidase ErfK/SrfK
MLLISRRAMMSGASATGVAVALGGCATRPQPVPTAQVVPAPAPVPAPDIAFELQYPTVYGQIQDGAFEVPGVKLATVNPAYLRKAVRYETSETPGSVVIDPAHHYLYLVQEGGRAVRYGVGVGREGFGWSGVATIHSKQEWPDWYPPKEMIQRQPELKKSLTELQSGIGMHGGPGNPLGARAMYLWQDNKDTLYRIHGTVEPWTIGRSVSSGCIRMINQDAIDLYQRTAVGTRVVVLPARVV